MAFVMMKASQLSALVLAFDASHRPIGMLAIAELTQQDIQERANLRNRQGRRVFFSRDESR